MQSMISPDERKFFEINGTDLLMLDLNVFCTTNANTRAMMERIQQMAVQNNTSGASIYEIGGVMEADSLGSLNNLLKKMDSDAQQRAELEHNRNKELQQQEAEARQKEQQMENDHDFKMLESKNRNNLMTAEIKAAGYGAQQDMNENKESDFVDVLNDLKQSEQYQESLNFDKTKEDNKATIANRKLDIEDKKVDIAKEMSDNQLRIARENQTKSEIDAKKKNNSKK